METRHPEGGESPFMAREDSSAVAITTQNESSDIDYINCPVVGCGEAFLLTELEGHVEMHEEEQGGSEDEDSSRGSKRMNLVTGPGETFDTKLSYALRNLGDEDDERDGDATLEREHELYEQQFGDGKSYERRRTSQDIETVSSTKYAIKSAKAAWRDFLKIPPSDRKSTSSSSIKTRRRLGKSELGPHAHEKQMPAWLIKLLEEDGAVKTITKLNTDGKLKKVKICPNMTSGIIPVLEQLLRQDEATDYAYLCDPAVKHVSKLKREGGFCGYRNIQMLTSYIINTKAPGHEVFRNKIPSIFKIQDYIEHAWDLGINAQGRIETGGIRGTRKYIGTPDAQAMLLSLDIPCDAQGLKPKRDSGVEAHDLLFEAVESYFMNGCQDFNSKVRCTSLPSIYFQHPGHSMTIVGFERKHGGSRNILVFDPMFHDSEKVTRLIGERLNRLRDPDDLLRAYRRGTKYLRKYNQFELLKLTHPSPASTIPLGVEPPVPA